MKASRTLLAAVALLASGTSCRMHSTGFEESDARVIGVSHVVVCWLKEPGNAEHRRRVIEACKGLIDIPGVQEVTVGTAIPSTRPVVDSSYDVAMVVRFRDEKAMRDYDQHPIHVNAIEKTLKPLVARFVVYDFQNRARLWSPAEAEPGRQ